MHSHLNHASHPQVVPTPFVRAARIEDAQEIGSLSAKAMHETIVGAIEAPLSAKTRILFDSTRFAHTWEETLKQLPSTKHHVFVAITANKIRGLCAIAPTTPFDFPNDHPAARALPENRFAYELTNFDLDSAHYGEEHEARMLAAITDTIGNCGTELYIWVFPSSENLIRFLDRAGFAPLGYQRELEIDGHTCTQQLWWTTF